MHLKAGLLTSLRKRLEEILTVDVVPEDVLPPVTPAHDVVDGSRESHSQLARHDQNLPVSNHSVKPTLWFDPYYRMVEHKPAKVPRILLLDRVSRDPPPQIRAVESVAVIDEIPGASGSMSLGVDEVVDPCSPPLPLNTCQSEPRAHLPSSF
jgi:hypothetical protein